MKICEKTATICNRYQYRNIKIHDTIIYLEQSELFMTRRRLDWISFSSESLDALYVRIRCTSYI